MVRKRNEKNGNFSSLFKENFVYKIKPCWNGIQVYYNASSNTIRKTLLSIGKLSKQS